MKYARFFALPALLFALNATWVPAAHAGLLEDDEARRAILDLRQRADKLEDTIKQLQTNSIEQQTMFETLRGEIARLRGEKEELEQIVKKQNALIQNFGDRVSKFEPMLVKSDGEEFMADPAEIKAYEDALAVFRKGDFVAAATSFNDFLRLFPRSGYVTSALFWVGNAQYANREYKDAIRNFNALITKSPQHLRAPESMLSVANCQVELKDLKSARKTFDDLVKAYPQSEAAAAAKERLSKLK
jgi:tol-pal system protein YbgF